MYVAMCVCILYRQHLMGRKIGRQLKFGTLQASKQRPRGRPKKRVYPVCAML